MTDAPFWKEFTIEQGGSRMDVWLSGQFHQLSRRAAQGFLEQGNVRVNHRPAQKNTVLSTGDIVTVLNEPAPKNWKPKANPQLELEVVLEDDAFIVINKPWNMPSCANSPADLHTLANAIATRYPECAGIGAKNGDAGLLHRLDNDTSGLLIAARNVRAYKSLKIQQENSQIEKRYLALVAGPVAGQATGLAPGNDGIVAPHTISVPLDSQSKGARKMGVAVKGGQRAVTHVEEVTPMGAFSLVKLLIYRGVRHQIRVHLAQKGFAICGDALYEGPSAPGLERLFLHASGLTFFHPVTSVPVVVSCPLPRELQQVISAVK